MHEQVDRSTKFNDVDLKPCGPHCDMLKILGFNVKTRPQFERYRILSVTKVISRRGVSCNIDATYLKNIVIRKETKKHLT